MAVKWLGYGRTFALAGALVLTLVWAARVLAETLWPSYFLKVQLAAAQAAHLEADETSVEWLYDPFWSGVAENPLQQRSRFVLLRNAIVTGMPGMKDARVLLPDGVSEATVSALRQLPAYRVYPRSPLEQKISFGRAGGHGARLKRSLEGPVLLLPPHTPGNFFHLHNDLVVKVAWLLRTNSLAPANTTLLLFKSSVAGSAHLFLLLERVLKQVIHPAESFCEGGPVFFGELYWSPVMSWPMDKNGGSEPFYQWTDRGAEHPWHWSGATGYWVNASLSAMDIQDPEGAQEKPLLGWVRRCCSAGDRQVANLDAVLLPELRRNLDVSVLGPGFSRAPDKVKDLLGFLRRADALAGIHGAGLAHVLYMRPGTLLLELKPDYGHEKPLFAEMARQRGIAYYAIDVRRHASRGGVGLPPSVAAKLSQSLREAIALRRAEARSPRTEPCVPLDWDTWRAALPSDGTLGKRWPQCGFQKPAFNELEARLQREVAVALPAKGHWSRPGPQPARSFREQCNNLKKVDLKPYVSAFSTVTPVAIVEQVSKWDTDSLGNAVPNHILSFAIGDLAGVPVVMAVAPDDEANLLTMMARRPFVPRHLTPPTEAEKRLREAVRRTCSCLNNYLHLCRNNEVWAVVFPVLHDRLRGALLEWADAGVSRAEVPGPGEQVVSPAATAQADLAAHVRCGDIFKYDQKEYGFLGLSAYRRALEGRDPQRRVRIVVFLSPTRGPLARQKDAARHELCTALGERLRRLLQREFHPAEVVLDAQAPIAAVWAQLAFAKRTLCGPSTFCLWPTLVSNRGFLADTPLFFGVGQKPAFPGVKFLTELPYLDMPAAKSKSVDQIADWIAAH